MIRSAVPALSLALIAAGCDPRPATFIGNCAAGSFLSPAQADFIAQLVFPSDFASLAYDAASCTTTPIGDAGSP